MRVLTGIFTALLCVLLTRCTSPIATNDGDGGGTRTGNPAVITAVVVDNNGKPLSNIDVTARLGTYLKKPEGNSKISDNYHTTTNSEGKFVINAIDNGDFYIEANDNVSNAVLFKCNIKDSIFNVNLGTDTITPHSTIQGKIDLPVSTETWVQIYGMDRVTKVDAYGYFYFANLPAGTYFVRLLNSNPSIPPTNYDSVTVSKGTFVTLSYASWKYAKKVYFNTTATGANTSVDLYNFPALIRLTSTNFNFSQAGTNGSDIRFRTVDGTTLPYEIESWDSLSAYIWVKLDTLKAKSLNQYIVMHWGNSSAVSKQNSLSVFDTLNGFAGVWHLSNNVNNASNKTTGIPYGVTNAQGMIGNCKHFDGIDDYIEINGLFNTPNTVTLSAWAQLDSSDTRGAEIVSIGDAVLMRMDNTFSPSGVQGAFCFDTLALQGVRHRATAYDTILEKTGWHYLTYVIDASKRSQTLFLDGEVISTTLDTSRIIYAGLGISTFIGKHGDSANHYDFTGNIDEVRICKTARTPEWIRACYKNQIMSSRMVLFKE